jgi:sugar lactone lactonase YvrE
MDAPQPVSLHPEVAAEFYEAWPSGIAVSRAGRIFVSFPRVEAVPAPFTLAEIVDGKAIPFPDAVTNALDLGDRARLVSAHGIAIGPRNRLLVLDTGARSFERCDPRAAKLLTIDLDRNAIVHAIGFAHDVCLPTTYLNDLVIADDRGPAGHAFISDSSADAIIVVDLGSGASWRKLQGDPAVRGIDGIALSPDERTLWWTPLGGHELYSIDTEILCAPHVDDGTLHRHVRRHAARGFGSDGLDTDRRGRVYFTDIEHGTVRRLIPEEDRYELLLGGEHLMEWPDAVRIGPDNIIYVTDSQLNRSPRFNGGRDERTRPFRLYRAAIDAEPAQY